MSANEGVNVNTPTTNVAEPVQGSGVTDFDELETLEKLGKQAKKDAAAAKAKDAPKGDGDYEQDASKSEKKEAKETKEQKPKDQKEQKDSGKPKKVYKFKSGESELELTPDGLIEVMVDGKPAPIQFQELVNNYAGKVAWEKRFSELDRDRKGFYADRDSIVTTLNQFHRLAVQDGDPIAALRFVAKALGGDPEAVEQQYLERSEKFAAEMAGKSPEEIRAIRAEQRLAARAKLDKAESESQQDAQMRADLEARVSKVLETTGYQPEDFRQGYEDLKAHGVKEITPEKVGEYLSEVKAMSAIGEALSEVAPSLEGQKLQKAMSDLRDQQKKYDLSNEDLKDIAKQVYGDISKAARLGKKIESQAKSGHHQRAMNPQSEPISWDEI